MPCMCWYHPSEEDKKAIKDLCVELVQRVKALEKEGDLELSGAGQPKDDMPKMIKLWRESR